MDDRTRRQLLAQNRRFYAAHAEAFSASRAHPWPGWERLLPLLDSGAAGAPLHVLDAGCGNGRFGRFLLERCARPLHYVGVDACAPLLAAARAALAAQPPAALELIEGDLMTDDPGAALPEGRFELVAAFGLLHHAPGAALRRDLLRALARRVAPGGLLACTFWRFGDTPRYAARSVPWSAAGADGPGRVDAAQLEPGDHLLTFGTGGGPLRYCHHCDDEEIGTLLAATGLAPVASWDADGRSGDLNRHAVLRRDP